MQLRIPPVIRRGIEKLPPYVSLLMLGVPLAVVEPLKLASVAIIGSGHVITGTLAILGAYAISLFITKRLFGIVKPKLLKLRWFAVVWHSFVRIRSRVLRWLGTRLGFKRKGLWVWEDGQ